MKNTYLTTIVVLCAQFSLLFLSTPIEHIFPALSATTAYLSMAICLILAGRFTLLDRLLGGPDKTYKIHRQFGYATVIASLIHWISAEESLTAIFPALADAAGDLGEFSVISLLTLVTISALRIIPYHLWKKSHLLMGPVFILISLHSFFSASPIAWFSVYWWLMVSFCLLAVIAWVKTIFKPWQKTTAAKIIHIEKSPQAIELVLQCPASLTWLPGQFAQLSFPSLSCPTFGDSDSHPFSIASSAQQSTARFIICIAGDHTQQLHRQLHLGDLVQIHSIAGQFLPFTSATRKRQLWIAAGTGITPFLAALDAMHSDQQAKIELIYAPGKGAGKTTLEQLKSYQRLKQFTLHVLPQGECLAQSHFNQLEDGWQQADLFLCGPTSLKESALYWWQKNNAIGKVHSEIFDFRGAISHKALQVQYLQPLIEVSRKRYIGLIKFCHKLYTKTILLNRALYKKKRNNYL